ncbi:unnamed protein product [Meganyctiphanes norvegica]|uniref:Ubiquitin-conjugating enzyme E2 S n=1 Tax=Meganyctiphanes norvegica TaxID=48144 RepID=A0AAV2QBG8_MEGNR
MASSSNVENLSPQILRGVMKEMTEIIKNPPEGVKVHLNDQDVTDIQATITGPAGTPYVGGVFKVKLALGKDFPSAPPKGFFITKIFHPNVASNGEICVNTLKRDWKSDLGIRHVFLVIKCLLIVPNPESALNEEAGKLLLEAYDDYASRAKMMTEIHAQGPKTNKGENSGESSQDGPQAKKHAGDKKSVNDRKAKLLKDKKRTLKRL